MKHNRKRIFCLLAVVMVLVSVLSIIPNALADNTPADWTCPNCGKSGIKGYALTCPSCGYGNPNNDMANSWQAFRDSLEVDLLKVAWDIGSTAAGGNPNFSLTGIAKQIYRIPTGKWINFSGKSYSMVDAAVAMYDVFKIIGIALILLYFLIEILDEVQADNFNFEHLIKKLITLVIAILVIMNGPTILRTVCDLGDSLLDDAEQAAAVGNQTNPYIDQLKDSLNDAQNEGGLLSYVKAALAGLGIIVDNLLPYLLYFVVLLVAFLISFSRFIEILVRFAFAPVGMAPLVSGGSKSAGYRYIKKFAAVLLQGAVCVLAFGAANVVIGYSNEVASFFAKILVPLTLIGFILKSQRIAEDIVGV